jgi:hypothetical protein
VISHHGVYASGSDSPEQFRLSEPGDVRIVFNSWLTDDSNVETVSSQVFADYRNAYVRAVDIGIAGDKYYVRPVPAEPV